MLYVVKLKKKIVEALKNHAKMSNFYLGIARVSPEGFTAAAQDNISSSGRDYQRKELLGMVWVDMNEAMRKVVLTMERGPED